jgi:NAD(P)-dependent dehydrogenase (short-subunit alcohol dehydrogenase family)
VTRAVLVTGASKGIGQATALRLARAGWRVFAGVRRDQDGSALQKQHAGIVPLRLDVTDSGEIEAAASRIADDTGGALHGVVNNAGIAVAGPLEYLPPAELRHQLDVNVVGQVAVTQALLPMLRRTRGRIVFVGSISGRSSLPFTGAYAASKHALEAIADAWRVELLPFGVRVVLIEPGVIATPIWTTSIAAGERMVAAAPAALQQDYGDRLAALRRRAERGSAGLEPDVVARAIEHAFTAPSPRTRYLIGNDARLRLWLQRLLPDRARDRLIAWRLEKM